MQLTSSFPLPGAIGNECASPCTTRHAERNLLPPERNREPRQLDAPGCGRGSEEQFSETVRSESTWLFLQLLRNRVLSACTAWPNVAGNLTAAACGKRPARKNERSLPRRPIDVRRCGSG
jgi:hypothetical protein